MPAPTAWLIAVAVLAATPCRRCAAACLLTAVLSILATLLVAAFWVRRRFVLVSIAGDSMQPTLRPGDRVVARRTPLSAVRRGDLVVVTAARARARGGRPELLIKRALAVPGDPVPAGRLPVPPGAGPSGRVPSGHLVLAGDNPSQSYDSRHYGYFLASQVLGVVVRPRRLTGDRTSR